MKSVASLKCIDKSKGDLLVKRRGRLCIINKVNRKRNKRQC